MRDEIPFHPYKGHCASSAMAEEIIAAELDLQQIYNATQQMNRGLEAYYNYEGHVRFFDVMGPSFEHAGEDFLRHWMAMGPQFQKDGFTLDFEDMQAYASGDVGFVSMIQVHRGGKDSNGEPYVFRFRATDGLCRIGGKWRIVHEHLSFPIDLNTRKAYGVGG